MSNSPITRILRQSIRKDDEPLNIITYSTHERFESHFSKLNHTFYLIQGEHIKPWREDYAKLPSNHILLPPKSELPVAPDFDIIWSQSKFCHFQLSQQISRQLNIPIVSLEHCLPPPNWNADQIRQMTNMKGHINVYISEYSLDKWLVERTPDVKVIKHCVDTDLFCPYDEYSNIERQNIILSVVNDWINRDWCCGFNSWTRIINGLPYKVVGDSKGLSLPATNLDELICIYNNNSIFLNTSVISPIPTSLLEAMSCGCAVVSTATCAIPEIIEHGINGFISNDECELRGYCELLLKDQDLARKLGQNARKTILEKCSQDRFLKEWQNVFIEVAKTEH